MFLAHTTVTTAYSFYLLFLQVSITLQETKGVGAFCHRKSETSAWRVKLFSRKDKDQKWDQKRGQQKETSINTLLRSWHLLPELSLVLNMCHYLWSQHVSFSVVSTCVISHQYKSKLRHCSHGLLSATTRCVTF